MKRDCVMSPTCRPGAMAVCKRAECVPPAPPAPVRPNGCHNRAPFKDHQVVQDGWLDIPPDDFGNPSRVPKWKIIAFRMSPDCRYSVDPMGLGPKDPRCAGCSWKQSP